jgi:hypothetical protein
MWLSTVLILSLVMSNFFPNYIILIEKSSRHCLSRVSVWILNPPLHPPISSNIRQAVSSDGTIEASYSCSSMGPAPITVRDTPVLDGLCV